MTHLISLCFGFGGNNSHRRISQLDHVVLNLSHLSKPFKRIIPDLKKVRPLAMWIPGVRVVLSGYQPVRRSSGHYMCAWWVQRTAGRPLSLQ